MVLVAVPTAKSEVVVLMAQLPPQDPPPEPNPASIVPAAWEKVTVGSNTMGKLFPSIHPASTLVVTSKPSPALTTLMWALPGSGSVGAATAGSPGALSAGATSS